MTDRPDLIGFDLEDALVDLGRALAPISAPGLSAAVRRRVEVLPVPAPARTRLIDRLMARPGRPYRRALVLAVIVLLGLAGLAAAIGFGLPGLRIVILDPGTTHPPMATATALPSTPDGSSPSPTGAATGAPIPSLATIETLGLGDRVSLAELDQHVSYHSTLPSLPALGAPIGVYVLGAPAEARLSAAYAGTSAFPAAPGAPTATGTPVAILVMEFPGASPAGYLEKFLPAGTTIETVTVASHPGFWIAGAPHDLLYVRTDGSTQPDTTRLAGNVLAWTAGSLTYRIEGAPDLAAALLIAGSMQ